MPRKDHNKPGGFVLIDRAMISHPIVGFHIQPPIGNRRAFAPALAWQWMIMEARYEANGLARGDFQHSFRYLAKAWNWKERAVKTFISKLVSAKMLKRGTQHGRRTVVSSICNYDKYQGEAQPASPPARPPEAKKASTKITRTLKTKKKDNTHPAEAQPAPVLSEFKPTKPARKSTKKPRASEDEVDQAIEMYKLLRDALKWKRAAISVRHRDVVAYLLANHGGIEAWRQFWITVWRSQELSGESALWQGGPVQKTTLSVVTRSGKDHKYGAFYDEILEGDRYPANIRKEYLPSQAANHVDKQVKLRNEDVRLREFCRLKETMWRDFKRSAKKSGEKVYVTDRERIYAEAEKLSFTQEAGA